MKKMSKFAAITGCCAAFSGFILGCMSLTELIITKDLIWAPYVVIGFAGCLVMYANSK